MFFLGENLFKEKVLPEPLSKTFSDEKGFGRQKLRDTGDIS